MRVYAIGAYRMAGTGKTSNKPYDMGKLIIRQPVENVATQTMTRTGYGFQTAELDVEPAVVAALNFTYPLELDVEVGSTVAYGKLQAIITGAKKVEPVSSVKAA